MAMRAAAGTMGSGGRRRRWWWAAVAAVALVRVAGLAGLVVPKPTAAPSPAAGLLDRLRGEAAVTLSPKLCLDDRGALACASRVASGETLAAFPLERCLVVDGSSPQWELDIARRAALAADMPGFEWLNCSSARLAAQHPLFFTQNEVASLQYLPLLTRLQATLELMQSDEEAHGAAAQAAGGAGENGSGPLLTADMLAHGFVTAVHAAARLEVGPARKRLVAALPVWDLVSLSADPNCAVEADLLAGELRLLATRRIKAKEALGRAPFAPEEGTDSCLWHHGEAIPGGHFPVEDVVRFEWSPRLADAARELVGLRATGAGRHGGAGSRAVGGGSGGGGGGLRAPRTGLLSWQLKVLRRLSMEGGRVEDRIVGLRSAAPPDHRLVAALRATGSPSLVALRRHFPRATTLGGLVQDLRDRPLDRQSAQGMDRDVVAVAVGLGSTLLRQFQTSLDEDCVLYAGTLDEATAKAVANLAALEQSSRVLVSAREEASDASDMGLAEALDEFCTLVDVALDQARTAIAGLEPRPALRPAMRQAILFRIAKKLALYGSMAHLLRYLDRSWDAEEEDARDEA